MRKSMLQVCVVAGALTVFYAATLRWSLGAAFSAVLTTATLAAAANGVRTATRIERIAILAWLYWGLSYVSNLIEAVDFHVLPAMEACKAAIIGLALACLVASGLEAFLPAPGHESVQGAVRVAPGLWWRVPLLAFLFFVIYLAAGIAIQPWIMSFYQGRPLPSLGQLFGLQLCRGVLDIACAFPLLRRWSHSRRSAVATSVYIFTVLCGWGPLLLPNAFLPGRIRLAHGLEMGASGIVFGMVTALLLLKRRPIASVEVSSL